MKKTLSITVYNESGSVLPKMAVIYIDGPHGNLPIALLAQANSESNSALTYGLIKNNIGSNWINNLAIIN